MPNAVDPGEWSLPPSPPAWFEALPGPRLLYVGSLESRIDVAAVARAARALPDASFALVGPMLDPPLFEELRRLANVTIRPAVGRTEVVALVAAADACLIPHVRNRLTEAMSPLKLYEYLAGGAPVAALDLPPIRDISRRVAIRDDLAEAVEAALALGRAPEEERRRFAADNSWTSRQGRIVEIALGAG